MALKLNHALSILEAASRTYRTTVDIVEDAALTLGPADQDILRQRLAELREQNDEGFDRLQAKLAKIAAG